MLHLAQKVAGVTVNGTDGEIGTLEDFYFEEAEWTCPLPARGYGLMVRR